MLQFLSSEFSIDSTLLSHVAPGDDALPFLRFLGMLHFHSSGVSRRSEITFLILLRIPVMLHSPF